MKKKEIWMITGGALMTLGGILALCVPSLVASVLSLILGIVSVLCGICYILSFWFLKRTIGAGFLLADGIVTGVLGLLLLLNQWLGFVDMNVLFTTLLLLIGLSLIVFSVQAKNYNVRKWWILIAVGGVSMAVGLALQIVPTFVKLATSLTVGILLIVGGLSLTVGTLMANRNRDKIITIREKDIEFIPDESLSGGAEHSEQNYTEELSTKNENPKTNPEKEQKKASTDDKAADNKGGKDENSIG